MVAAIDTQLGSNSWRAGGAGASNLTVTRDAGSLTVQNDGGSDAVLPGASDSAAGVMTAADKAKLDGLSEALATPASDGLMSGADKARLDGLSNALATPASDGLMSGADKAKLDGVNNALATSATAGLMSGADKAKLDALSVVGQPGAAIEFVIDGGGSAIAPGQKGFVQVPMNCTVTAARLLADQPGSIVVDIWKDSFANYPPADADSITAAAPLTLSGGIKSEDTALAGWTKGISAGDILAFNVDSASAVGRVTVVLLVTLS